MGKFKQYISEMPINIKNAHLSPISIVSSRKIKEIIGEIDLSNSKKLFGDFRYIIHQPKDDWEASEKLLLVILKEVCVLYIKFYSIKKDMHIEIIENISNEKNLSFRVYSAVLNKNIFERIYTGDALTTLNINAHKKFLINDIKGSAFKLYIQNGKDKHYINSEQDFDEVMAGADHKTQFILEDSQIIEAIYKTYGNKEKRYNEISELIVYYIE